MARTKKIRRLVFDTTNPEHATFFAMLYHGFVIGGSTQQSRGIDVMRREAKMLDKFEDIGSADTPEGSSVKWSDKTNEMELEQNDYDMLRNYVEKTPWTTRVTRDVVAVIDWLASAQPEDGDAG